MRERKRMLQPGKGDSTEIITFLHAVAADDAVLQQWLAAHDISAEMARWFHSQGVAPFVFYRLRRAGVVSRLSVASTQILESAYHQTISRNLLLHAEAQVWARRFAEAGIVAIWLKGIPLSLSIYQHFGLRPMGDIDLLVPRPQLQRALRLVHEITGQAPATLAEDSAMHAVFQVGHNRQIKMEIHWSLLDIADSQLAADVDWFLGQSQSLVDAGGVELLTLLPEAHFLYLCAHAEISHGEGQFYLLRYLDLHLLITQCSLDWRVVLDQAVTFGWTFAVERALLISQEYFATPLPDFLLGELRSRRPAHEDTSQVIRRQTSAGRWGQTLNRFRDMSYRTRIRLALQLTFPPFAYMRWRYRLKHWWQLPLYYPYRWFDVLREIVRSPGGGI